jgi:hypothetical protein
MADPSNKKIIYEPELLEVNSSSRPCTWQKFAATFLKTAFMPHASVFEGMAGGNKMVSASIPMSCSPNL